KEIGATNELVSLLGSSIPFAPTRSARDAAKDPRRSIEERYGSREDYLAKIEQAAEALVKSGYLLIDDVPRILQRSSDTWDDLVTSRKSQVASRRSLVRDRLGRHANLHLVADEEAAGLERGVPQQAELFPVERQLGLESGPSVA